MTSQHFSRLWQWLPFAKKQTWFERRSTTMIVIGAVVATSISLLIGLQQSVWFDEAYSIMIAKQPLGQLIHLTAVDTHPPLYYLLLKAWAGLFGWSELALRSLSALALGGSVVCAGLLARRMFGARVALTALPFVVFAPFLLRYGFEIRMYALASLIGVAATYVLVAALQAKHSQRQWVLFALYGLLVVIGMYTLYYMALLWVAHVVWLAWLTWQQKQPLLKARWVLALAGSVVLFLPWLPTFLSQVNNGALALISQPLTIDNLAGIISFGFVYQPAWQLTALLSLVILFVIIFLSYATVQAFKRVPKPQRAYLFLLALYVLVPVAVLAAVSLVRPMYTERYIAHVIIGGSLFVGAVVALLMQKRTATNVRIMCGLLLVVSLYGVVHLAQVGNFNFQRLQTPTVKQAAAAIPACSDDTAVLAADPYVAIELSYYLPHCQIHFYSETVSLSGGYAPLSHSPLHVTKTISELASKRAITYVYYAQPQLQMPEQFVQTRVRTYDALTVATFSAE